MQKMNLPDDDKFVYYATLPNLQEMASFQVALSIWHSYISQSKLDPKFSGSNIVFLPPYGRDVDQRKNSDKLIECLNVPRSVKETVGHYLIKVQREMALWIYRSRCDFFSYEMREFNLDAHVFEDPTRCVWMPNGEVDYVKSASKLISADELSNEQRFAIMSIFCMEDKIKTVSIDSLSESFIHRVTYEFDPELYYWICYLKQELHKVPLGGFDSTDKYMYTRCKYNLGTLYFFNRIREIDRLQIASYEIRNYCGSYELYPLYAAVYRQKILSALSFKQQLELISEDPEHIIMNVAWLKESHRCALWVWKHSKKLMTEVRFCGMMKKIFLSWTPDENKILLIEMWETASENERNFVTENLENTWLLELISSRPKNTDVSKFLYRFLSLKNADSRYELVFSNVSTFEHYICAEAGSIENEIFNLCIPSSDDRENLRKIFV